MMPEISHVMFTFSTTLVVQYAKITQGLPGYVSLVELFISKQGYILAPPHPNYLAPRGAN